jgi:hypothetical protein
VLGDLAGDLAELAGTVESAAVTPSKESRIWWCSPPRGESTETTWAIPASLM